ncbi:hypothetical protein MMC26_001578 [Xylographa opegraphella]|nr:hypothetical protein [Xylographa opegraphella]
MALLLLGVKSSKDGRAGLQNGYWGPKVIVWLGFIVLTFLIPESFFQVWGRYFAFIGAMLFVLLGLILLVDLAHTYAEFCLEKIENYDSKAWRVLLIGSTLGMYTASFAMTILMYIFFAGHNCSMNQAAITVNLIVLLIISFLSVHPAVQESNPKAGLAQSAMVAIYCTYLTMSAVSMEPDDKQCNPLVRANGARTASIVLGAIVTMLTIAYTTTRAATQGFALGTSGGHAYAKLGEEEVEHGMIDQQPMSARREMRAEALRAAVEAGSLPASALNDDDDDESDDGRNGKDDEKGGTQYNYSLFHVIFLLATCWVATLLTQQINDIEMTDPNFAPVGRSYWASWVKIPEELQVLREQYEKEGDFVGVQTKFNYAWGLIKSNNRGEQQEGVRLLSEIYRNAPERRRECLYYLALGNFKLGNYAEARRYNESLLQHEPANMQAASLQGLIDDKVAKEGLVGVAIVSGVAIAAGVIGSLIFKGARRR